MDLNLNTTQTMKQAAVKAPKASVARKAETDAPEKRKDPWEIMIDFSLPRPPLGESHMMSVHLNREGGDYEAYLPRGKQIKAPLPVYQLLQRVIKAEEKHRILSEELQGDHKIGER